MAPPSCSLIPLLSPNWWLQKLGWKCWREGKNDNSKLFRIINSNQRRSFLSAQFNKSVGSFLLANKYGTEWKSRLERNGRKAKKNDDKQKWRKKYRKSSIVTLLLKPLCQSFSANIPFSFERPLQSNISGDYVNDEQRLWDVAIPSSDSFSAPPLPVPHLRHPIRHKNYLRQRKIWWNRRFCLLFFIFCKIVRWEKCKIHEKEAENASKTRKRDEARMAKEVKNK